MHHKYSTEAFILKSFHHKDADKVFILFTEAFGLIRASAQGVRLLKSKLRYHLTDFSCLRITLVRGRDYWRIVGAERLVDFPHSKIKNPEVLDFYGRIFSLILRLVHGEEKNDELFIALKGSLLEAHKNQSKGLECLSVARIMRCLGYLKTAGFEKLFENHDYDEKVIYLAESMHEKIIMEINKSLNETHL